MAARKLTVSHINPASAFKVASLMALAGFVAWMIGVALVYFFLAQTGVVESVNSLIAGVGVVVAAVLAPLAAVIYNAIANLTGGITVTLTNR